MTDLELQQTVDSAFGMLPRPEHFTDHRHCAECAEHDQTLLACLPEQLERAQLGVPGWDPVTFCSVEAKAYLLPTLVRLTLAEPDAYYGWYGPQLLNHLSDWEQHNALWQFCQHQQRQAIAALLTHLIHSRAELLDAYGLADDWIACHQRWCQTDPNPADPTKTEAPET